MILAVTPNPSIDRAVIIDHFRLGEIHRPGQVLSLAGGKGLNVARAVQRLGGQVRACVLLAGHNGRWISEQLERECIPYAAAWAEGETRISTSIIDPSRPELTEIYERGDPVSPTAWAGFETMLSDNLPGVSWATFSGSLPLGASPDSLGRLVRKVQDAGIAALVDARGKYLCAALQTAPALIKINAEEAGELLACEIHDFEQALQAVQVIRRLGAGAAIITLGSLGAAAANLEGQWIARSPNVAAIAPVGSGDAFLGGLAVAFGRGASFGEALRLAVAAGAANAMTVGVAMIDPEVATQLAAQVEIIPA